MEKTLDFWFEYASPYSYPAAMRVEQLAAQRAALHVGLLRQEEHLLSRRVQHAATTRAP